MTEPLISFGNKAQLSAWNRGNGTNILATAAYTDESRWLYAGAGTVDNSTVIAAAGGGVWIRESPADVDVKQAVAFVDNTIAYAGIEYLPVADYEGDAEGFGGGPYSGLGWGLPRPGTFGRFTVWAKDEDASNRSTSLVWEHRNGSFQGDLLRSGSVTVSLSLAEYTPVPIELDQELTANGVLYIKVAAPGGRISLLRLPDGQEPAEMPLTYIEADGNDPARTDLWAPVGSNRAYTFNTLLERAGTRKVVEFQPEANAEIVGLAVPTPILAIPATLYAIEGVETNLWYETLYQWPLGSADAYIVTASGYGSGQDRRWTVTPTAADAGPQTVTFSVYDNQKTLMRTDTLTVQVSTAGAGDGVTRKMLLIGDSHGRRGFWTGALQQRMDAASGMTFQQVGPFQTENSPYTYNASVPGYSFTSFWQASNVPDASGHYNPFWNPNSNQFDFSYFLQQTGISLGHDDWVTWALGTNSFNDPWFLGHGSDSLIERDMRNLKEMVRRIRLACDARIAIMTVKPIGYAARLGHFEDLPQLYSRRLIQDFGGREGERIYVTPQGVALDRLAGFSYIQQATSDRTSDVTERYCPDPIHPRQQGYQQIADSDYAFYKWFA